MKSPVLFAVAISCISAETASGEDYLLRFETIGYVDRPADEKEPKELVLQSIEIVARPESTFHGKVRIGTETLVLSGALHSKDGGKFRVHVRYTRSVDSGLTVATERGAEPVLNTSSLSADIAILVDCPTVIGGFDSRKASAVPSGYETTISKARHVLLLTRYDAKLKQR